MIIIKTGLTFLKVLHQADRKTVAAVAARIKIK